MSTKGIILRDYFDLELTPYGRGYSYQWHGPHGDVVCSGWHPGTIEDARATAITHIETGKDTTA